MMSHLKRTRNTKFVRSLISLREKMVIRSLQRAQFWQIDEENGPILSTIVRNHFRSINIVRGVTKSKSPHRQSLIMRHRPSNLIEDESRTPSQEFFLSLEREHAKISPQVEGRITMVTEENDIKKAASFSEDEENALNNVKAQQTGIKDLSMVV
ncbi:PREDICTED: uncharacterized protein LOC107330501 isoform X2 [Acropora digitifera]|uniref:uncharacterized protein LOC107330501 isoform X2 n=1 Tax=Acropora digitifera TaxID=70779 RepID=UPI00077A5510|nr:PREDICTED: uncharacterized protein LOC107330501 isoform X2 [Acropora digitifera]